MLKARWLAPGRRGVLITLTPQGRSLVDTAAAQHLANERRILSGLTAAEQRQLAGLLRKLSLTLPPQEKDEPPAGSGEPDPAADDSQQNTPAGTPRATCAPPALTRPGPSPSYRGPGHTTQIRTAKWRRAQRRSVNATRTPTASLSRWKLRTPNTAEPPDLRSRGPDSFPTKARA